jgi:hypothetical protein
MKPSSSPVVGAVVWLDPVIAVAIKPLSWVFRGVRRVGFDRLPQTRASLIGSRVIPVTDHYYEPFVSERSLRQPLSQVRTLPGIELDEGAQLSFLASLSFRAELESLRLDRPATDPRQFQLGNGSYDGGDCDFLYQFLRHKKPQTVIEIGSGNSTKIAALALERNAREGGRPARHLCIEPFEQPWLETLGVEIIRKKVEEVELSLFAALGENDLLFIDSSHVIRPQGDVLHEYLNIVSSLRAGVFVHAHDIFTPRDYPRSWVLEHLRLWNEQYLLEALLAHSPRYSVVAALNFLKHQNFEALKAVCSYLGVKDEPSSFYFRVNGPRSESEMDPLFGTSG